MDYYLRGKIQNIIIYFSLFFIFFLQFTSAKKYDSCLRFKQLQSNKAFMTSTLIHWKKSVHQPKVKI